MDLLSQLFFKHLTVDVLSSNPTVLRLNDSSVVRFKIVGFDQIDELTS